MVKKSASVGPYKSSPIHAIYQWINRLPGPYWIYSLVFLVTTGLLNTFVAWKAHVMPFGEINWYYATTGIFFAYLFFANDFLLRIARNAISDFLATLDVDENKKRLILFEFTNLPAKTSGGFFVFGAIIGFFLGIYLVPNSPENNYAFPAGEVTIYSLSIGMAFITLYVIIRSSKLISRLFDEKVNIDLFDQTSLYAISRYSAWTSIIIAIAIYMQFVVAPSFVEITALYLVMTFTFLFMILLVFWLPLRGANRILVLKKRRLLKDINLRIRNNFDLLHSKMDNHDYKNIADIREMIAGLQAEREDIKSISTLPWQTSTITSLFTAVVLPVFVGFLISIFDKFIGP